MLIKDCTVLVADVGCGQHADHLADAFLSDYSSAKTRRSSRIDLRHWVAFRTRSAAAPRSTRSDDNASSRLHSIIEGGCCRCTARMHKRLHDRSGTGTGHPTPTGIGRLRGMQFGQQQSALSMRPTRSTQTIE